MQEKNLDVEELRVRLEEAQETLNAIRRGEIDGLVVSTPKGDKVYTISGAEKPYRDLIEKMNEGAVMLSDDNSILYCNNGFAKLVKLSLEKIIGLNIEKLVFPTQQKIFRDLLGQCRAAKNGAAYRAITFAASDKSLVPTQVSINSLSMDKTCTTFLVVTDLTEHMDEEVKRYTEELELAQLALAESEQRWSTTLASIGDAVIATDLSGKISFMNTVAEQLTGWTLAEASQKPIKNIFNIINAKTQLQVENPVSRVLTEGIVVGLANHTVLVRKNGTEIPIDDSGAPIKDKQGKITGVVLIFRDITKRKKSEEALAKTKNQYELLFNSVTEGFANYKIVFDKTGNLDLLVLDINPAGAKQTGVKREEQVGKTWRQIWQVIPEEVLDIYRRVYETGKARTFEHFSPITKAWYIINVNKSAEDQFAVTFFDNTERKKAELELKRRKEELENTQRKLEENAIKLKEYSSKMEELAQHRANQLKDAERLAAIGATAGMVGHDIRNPLQAIISDVFLAKCDLEKLSPLAKKESVLESLSEIEKNVDYINKIVADLQDYSRVLKPLFKEVDLESLCNDVILKNDIPKKIEASCVVHGQVKTLMVDPDLLKRILTNLVSNAVNAMPNGGRLTLHAFKEENNIVVTVQDTGVGIPDEIKPKLFTPLFTTRAKGQGFGLPVVKRMTEALGGEVTFESQVGRGTKFTVRFPPTKSKR